MGPSDPMRLVLKWLMRCFREVGVERGRGVQGAVHDEEIDGEGEEGMPGGHAGREPYKKDTSWGGGRLAEQHGQHFDDRGGTGEAGGDQPEHGDEGGHGQAERGTGQPGGEDDSRARQYTNG